MKKGMTNSSPLGRALYQDAGRRTLSLHSSLVRYESNGLNLLSRKKSGTEQGLTGQL